VSHPSGRFTWTDISLPDVAAGKAFYEAYFGWSGEDQFDPDGNLIYVMFTKDGRSVAGMGPLPEEMQNARIPPMWNSYINVESVDVTLDTTVAAGGTIVMPALDVPEAGRMAIISDPAGGVVSLWQAREHRGADHFNDPGEMSWNELATRDVEAAKAFYAAVFGWTYETGEMPGGFFYTTILLDGQPNGGIMAMDDNWPAGIPPHWMVYFRVEDTDRAAKELEELGGSVSVPPFDSPAGKIAVVGDPQGGTYSIIGPPPDAS
jgi:predicted enzyme related to lactoylglutathione lyase